MCGNCNDCPFVNAPVDKLFYEIHITVEENEVSFMDFGYAFSLSPIKIANFNSNNQLVNYDFMTSYKVTNDEDPFQIMADLQSIISKEFKIIRSKIETVPWHPLCNMKEIPTGYFEAHFKVEGNFDVRKLNDVGINLYKSHRVLSEDIITNTTMLTYREATTRNLFETNVDALKNYFEQNEIKLADKPIIEYALYDTNVEHDKEWMK